MSDFCKQCSIELFGEDFGDLAGVTTSTDWAAGKAAVVLCENCGVIQVDPEGSCISSDCTEGHNKRSMFYYDDKRFYSFLFIVLAIAIVTLIAAIG